MLNIYKASAGSGKTFNLAYWYIKLLLGEIDPETRRYTLAKCRPRSHAPILAVTFTNKATQEMKERIIAQLSKLAATPEKSDYIDWLKRDLNTSDTAAIAQVAREALASLLFSFSMFNISTIDSFFQQILRSFAIEIDRPGNFTVEMDESLIMNMAVDELFDTLDTDTEVREWVRLFMLGRLEQNETVNLFNKDSGLHSELVDTLSSFMTEDYRLNRDVIDGYLQSQGKLTQFYKSLQSLEHSMLQTIKNEANRAASIFEPYQVNHHIKNLINSLREKGMHPTILKTAEAVANGDPDKAFTGSAKVKASIPFEVKQTMADLMSLYVESYYHLNILKLVRSQLFLFGLLGKVTTIADRICRENNIILISNTNELINKIIGRDPSISPFIYERVGARLHNFLMDEFQDTSALQWLNMKPLLEESLSYKFDNLIIGDEKQCIYRFRNSSPELLSYQVREQMVDICDIDERGNKIEENTNWRSTPEVIRFNNTVFNALGHMIDPRSAYSHVMQGISPKNIRDHGHVKVKFFEKVTEPMQEDEPAKSRKKKQSPSAIQNEKVLGETVAELRRLLQHYSPGEIAILVEKRKQGEAVIAELLKAMDDKDSEPALLPRFEIVSNDALCVSSSASVKMLVNQLRLAGEPEEETDEDSNDNENKQWVRRTSSDFAMLEHKFEKYCSESPEARDTLAGIALKNALYDGVANENILTDVIAGHQCNDLVSLVERLVAFLPAKLREEETIFITAFQDLVINYSERGNGDIRGFLTWWNKIGVRAKINSPENKNALTVSTIHKSKGLEYPCVLIPFGNWVFQEDSSKGKNIFNWYMLPDSVAGRALDFAPPMLPLKKEARLADTAFKPQYEVVNHQQNVDALNLTYVAFTRAKRELVIFTQEPARGGDHSLYSFLMQAFLSPYNDMIERIEAMSGDDAETLALLRDSVVDLAPMFDQENGVLEYGITDRHDKLMEKNKKTESEEAPRTEAPISHMSDYTLRNYATLSETMPSYKSHDNERILKFMRLADDDDFDPDNARQKGVFMHAVLSKVRSYDDLLYACRQRGQKVGLTENVIHERYTQLKKAMAHPDAVRWFEGCRRVVAERTIIDKMSGRHTRPDRVVWTADGHVDVVDFKFGDSANSEKYLSQVRGYVKRMRQARYSNVRGYLWYPLENLILTVDDNSNESLI